MDHFEEMEELQDQLDEARASGNRPDEAAALYGIGRIYSKEGHHEAAEDFWSQCAEVCRGQQLRAELGQVTLDLGDLAVAMNLMEQARERYLDALGIYRENGLLSGEAKALERLASLAGNQGLVDEAMEHLHTGLKLCQVHDDNIGSLFFLEQIIPILRLQKAVDAAEQEYRRLITLAEKVGDRDRMALGLVGLADLFETRGAPGEAVPYLALAHDLYIRLDKPREAGLIRKKIEDLKEAGPV